MAVLCVFYLIVVVFWSHGEPFLPVTILVMTDIYRVFHNFLRDYKRL